MEFNIISSWIDRNPVLNLKRTSSYLKYVARFWHTVDNAPLRDIDQFRMYLADKNRCTLNKQEQAYAERCRKIVNTVYAALVDEALGSAASMNYEEIGRRAEELLQTTPSSPIIIDLRTSPVSPPVGRCVERFGAGWRPSPSRGVFSGLGRFWTSLRGHNRAPAEAQRSGFGGKRRSCGMSDFSPFGAEMRDMEPATTRSRIKAWRRFRRSCRSHLPAVRAVYGSFKVVGFWRLFQGICSRLASADPKPPMAAGFSAASYLTSYKDWSDICE